MKKILLLYLFIFAVAASAQEKMTTKNGVLLFEASVPFFEAVEAKNVEVVCTLNTKKGIITIVVFVKKFHFKRNLMKEHFNKNYLESDRYSKATFKGLIEKFDLKDIKGKMTQYKMKGKITIHGKSKNIKVICMIKKTKEGIELGSRFSINTADYNIAIPTIIRSKISKTVNLHLTSTLQ
jgi:hypothetical protein